MVRKYLSVGTWIDKKTGYPKSSLGEITEGTSKEGKSYQFTETKSTMTVDEFVPVGTIINYEMVATGEVCNVKSSKT